MKSTPVSTALILCFSLILAGLVSSCTSSNSQGSPIYYEQSAKETPRSITTIAKDTLVLTRVKSKIFSDDLVSEEGIDIMVRNGVVFLEGTTSDRYQSRMIENLIRSVDGVVGVENNLKAIHTGTTFVNKGSLVAEKIQTALMKDQELGRLPIMVQATSGQVVITGSVTSQAQKQRASAIAEAYAESRPIMNQLTVR